MYALHRIRKLCAVVNKQGSAQDICGVSWREYALEMRNVWLEIYAEVGHDCANKKRTHYTTMIPEVLYIFQVRSIQKGRVAHGRRRHFILW
jgi:hypothetical protein